MKAIKGFIKFYSTLSRTDIKLMVTFSIGFISTITLVITFLN